MFLIIGGVLLLVTMQIFATLGALLVVGISAVSALGLAGWFGIPRSAVFWCVSDNFNRHS